MSFTIDYLTEKGMGIAEYLDQYNERINLMSVTLRFSSELTEICHLENEFSVNKWLGTIWRTSTGKELYHIIAAETVNGKVIQVQPLTDQAKHYLNIIVN